MSKRFTFAEDAFLRNNLQKCRTLYDLTDLFNAEFPSHTVTYSNLQKRLQKLDLKKGTHYWRKEKVRHKNEIGTIIQSGRRTARIKTKNGYINANSYFREKYGRSPDEMIIHLNGDLSDFAESNIRRKQNLRRV